MPRIERHAELVWKGNLAGGEGHVTAGTGAFADLPYSLPTRIGQAEGKSSPEELMAAAHGGCITMSLAGELTSLGHPADRIDVTCRIVMDEVEGQGHQIVGSQLTVRVGAPGLDDETLATGVELADGGCPFSALLKRAGADVDVAAERL